MKPSDNNGLTKCKEVDKGELRRRIFLISEIALVAACAIMMIITFAFFQVGLFAYSFIPLLTAPELEWINRKVDKGLGNNWAGIVSMVGLSITIDLFIIGFQINGKSQDIVLSVAFILIFISLIFCVVHFIIKNKKKKAGSFKHVSGLPFPVGAEVNLNYEVDSISFKCGIQTVKLSLNVVRDVNYFQADDGSEALYKAGIGGATGGFIGAIAGATSALKFVLAISYSDNGVINNIILDASQEILFADSLSKQFKASHNQTQVIDLVPNGGNNVTPAEIPTPVIKEEPTGAASTPEASLSKEKLYRAIEIVIEEGQCSTSSLQRSLAIGFGTVTKLVDTMEEMGIVGPLEPGKPRQVLITKQEWEEYKRTH